MTQPPKVVQQFPELIFALNGDWPNDSQVTISLTLSQELAKRNVVRHFFATYQLRDQPGGEIKRTTTKAVHTFNHSAAKEILAAGPGKNCAIPTIIEIDRQTRRITIWSSSDGDWRAELEQLAKNG